MRFIIAEEFYQQMLQIPGHTADCYVRPGEYLHHMYIEGVKYTIAPAVLDCLAHAEEKGDQEAIDHLRLHKMHYDGLLAWLRGLVGTGYVAEDAMRSLVVVDDVDAALAACAPRLG